MIVIPCQEPDATNLAQIFSILYKPEIRWSEEKIRKHISQHTREYYLSFQQTLPAYLLIGALSLQFHENSCELEAIVAIPRRNGNGSQLLEFAEVLARERKCQSLWCHCLEIYHCEDFYKKNEWKEEIFIPNFYDGQNAFRYVRDLSVSIP